MIGEATWGELKADYNKAQHTSFGGLFGGLGSYFSKEYAQGTLEGARSAAWETPKAAIMSVVRPVREDIFKTVPMVGESLQGFKLEIFKDIAKPVAYTIGHIRHKILHPLKLADPITWFQSAWGAVTLPFAIAAGVVSALVHIPGDLLSPAPSFVVATAMTVGSVGQQYFSGFRNFGKGALVMSDTIERATNRFIVPPGWSEHRDQEYNNIRAWGQEFHVS